jgi:hypothetical protein
MAMQEIKKAYAWQEALNLSKRLVQICEEFSDADTNVLVWHLRQAVVEIPATIAADLQANRGATMEPVVKLGAELELVHKIYPAIETGDADDLLTGLTERMQSDRFGEREPEPEADGDAAEATSANGGGSAPQVDGVQSIATTSDSGQPGEQSAHQES